MARLSPVHRRYVLIETAVSMVFNTIVSIPFAYLAAHGAAAVPLWGPTGMWLDLILTVFMITLVTALIVTIVARRRVGAGRIAALDVGQGGWVERTPVRVLQRSLVCALVGAAVLVPLSLIGLTVIGVSAIAMPGFVAFKAAYAAVVSGLITPPVARAALCPIGTRPQAATALQS